MFQDGKAHILLTHVQQNSSIFYLWSMKKNKFIDPVLIRRSFLKVTNNFREQIFSMKKKKNNVRINAALQELNF